MQSLSKLLFALCINLLLSSWYGPLKRKQVLLKSGENSELMACGDLFCVWKQAVYPKPSSVSVPLKCWNHKTQDEAEQLYDCFLTSSKRVSEYHKLLMNFRRQVQDMQLLFHFHPFLSFESTYEYSLIFGAEALCEKEIFYQKTAIKHCSRFL